MGINRAALKIFDILYKKKFFEKINSVIELGSQEVYVEHNNILLFLKSIGRKNPKLDLKKAYQKMDIKTLRKKLFPRSYLLNAKNIYNFLGIKDYECIDSNGHFGAHIFDLDKDISKEYKYKKKFDLVTNNGTTEHVFNQYTCFKNIHDLTKVGGYMFHAVPFIGYLEHGFYLYSASFFLDLAFINNYEIKAIWTCSNDDILKSYSKKTAETYLKKQGEKDVLIICLFKKVLNKDFKMPFQGKYIKTAKIKRQDEKSNIKFLKPKIPFLMKIAKKILNSKILK